MKHKLSTILKLAALIMIIVGGILAFKYTMLAQYANPEAIQQMIQIAGIYGPLVYILVYSIAPILAFPGSVLSLAGGLAFGVWLGTFYTIIGASIGASLAFLVARFFGREFVKKFEHGKLKQFDEGAEKHGFSTILILRLIPLVPFNALNFGAGLSKIKAKDYILATALGIIPGTFAYNVLGGNLTNIFSARGAIAIAVFIVVLVVPLAFKKKVTRKLSL